MAFVLVEFDKDDGGGVAVVHSSWLTPRKNESFWPPYKEQHQFDKALKNGCTVNTETWRIYKLNKIFYECDDLTKARLKAKEAELTSNIESEEEPDRKRKRKKNTRIYSQSSSDTEGTSSICLPRPRRIKRTNNSSPQITRPSLSQEISQPISTVSTLQSQTINSFSTPRSLPQANTKFSYDSEKIGKLISLVAAVKEQNNEILEWIRKQSKIVTPTTIRPHLNVEVPFNTLDDLNSLEEDLRSIETLSKELVSYLSTLGGKDTVTRTNRILKYLFKDAVATSFSYFGKRNNKRPFCDLLLKNIIVGKHNNFIVQSFT
ncbi:unnamed protein product [Phyllotreta striolata]|uniref:DUF4806 domain-containing protein n=1 Tax=Phyllotreta striolata TaxID=444603 RepID=A0A9N9TMI7_PHYSR|nr:unnamed protein product [Phyllotreta striolata]CAG9864419.1 unnamed protein product [Phyllotreta striolata]